MICFIFRDTHTQHVLCSFGLKMRELVLKRPEVGDIIQPEMIWFRTHDTTYGDCFLNGGIPNHGFQYRKFWMIWGTTIFGHLPTIKMEPSSITTRHLMILCVRRMKRSCWNRWLTPSRRSACERWGWNRWEYGWNGDRTQWVLWYPHGHVVPSRSFW